MNMDEWMVIVVAIIAITACVKTGLLISRNQNNATTPSNSGNQVITYVGGSSRSATETGPMVYYANDNHGRRDKEYRFNYKKVNGSWRAYILRMPSLAVVRQMVTQLTGSGMVLNHMYAGIAR